MEKTLLDGSRISHLAQEPIDFLNLAFIGDAIFSVYCKGEVLSDPANKKLVTIHLKSNHYLNASYQAAFLKHLSDNKLLNEYELTLVRRARNSVMNTTGKKNIAHYRYATAFEALIGYLYITDQRRFWEILGYTRSFEYSK